MSIVDTLGRTFKTLRISLTNTCNLACTYCVNDQIINVTDTKKSLKVIDFQKIVQKINQVLDLETIRLTGGEPTLFKEIVPLIKSLKSLEIPIKITTNGFLLKNLVDNLAQDDIHTINVSLDALDEDLFFKISKRKNLHKIIEGIDAALSKGIKVKLNCVVIKGLNDSQILPLIKFAKERNIVLRFLELMKMGHINDQTFDLFYSEAEILQTISSQYDFKILKRGVSSTANYWQTSEKQIFGIIANESSPFCHDCNRLRLDSFGNIYGCLSNSQGINVSEYIDNQPLLEQKLTQALAQKQNIEFVGSKMSMLDIGG